MEESMRSKKIKQGILAVIVVSAALISISFSMWQLIAYLALRLFGYVLPFWTFGPLLFVALLIHMWLSYSYSKERRNKK